MNEAITLNDLGNEILLKAEMLLGSRHNHPFIGFFYANIDNPVLNLNGNMYLVYVSTKAKNDLVETHFQVSHEVIHLLSPTTFENVSVFEEGLATYFSIEHLKSIGFSNFAESNLEFIRTNNPKHFEAYMSVYNISDILQKVKKVREQNVDLKISDFAFEHFSEITDDKDAINYWTAKFNCW